MDAYVAMGRALKVSVYLLYSWTFDEEEQLIAWEALPRAREAPFPFPLLHHMKRVRA
jgi:hypothetical protein